jgi:hypothetical protein
VNKQSNITTRLFKTRPAHRSFMGPHRVVLAISGVVLTILAPQAHAGGSEHGGGGSPPPPGPPSSQVPLGFSGTGYGGFSTSGAGVSGVSSASRGGSATGGAGGQSTSSASTGAQTLSTGNQALSLGTSGNSSTYVDAANRSSTNTTYSEIFIPAVIPATPSSSLAAGNLVKDVSSCGPLMAVQRIPITGAFFGMVKRQDVEQGFTESVVPYLDRSGRQQMYLDVPLASGAGYTRFGHRVVQTTTVIGTAGARNLALGGGGAGGSWGQVGGGASSSMQQIVTTVQLEYCEIGEFKPRPQIVPVSLPVIPPQAPIPNPPPTVVAPPKKPPVRHKPPTGMCHPTTCS